MKKITIVKRIVALASVVFFIAGAFGLFVPFFSLHGIGITKPIESLNEYGDYMGGVAGAFWSMSGSLIVAIAFLYQLDQFKRQDQFEFRNNFERLYYFALDSYVKIVSKLSHGNVEGPQVFEFYVEKLRSSYALSNVKDEQEKIFSSFEEFEDKFGESLLHYFEMIDFIFSHLKTVVDDKYYYKKFSLLLKGVLSNSERVLLSYYYMSKQIDSKEERAHLEIIIIDILAGAKLFNPSHSEFLSRKF